MRRISIIVVCGAISSFALAGPEWPEVGDAGSLPGSAQVVTGGGGSLTAITGSLGGPPGLPGAGVGDFQDMYLIDIKDPFAFRASTLDEHGGSADFDAQLWLFYEDGRGLLGNQDATFGATGALLLNQSNDGSGAELVTPGRYLIAITGAGSVPLGGPQNELMFDFTLGAGEISGADGPGGGGNPIMDWTTPGEFGLYQIALEGVSTIVPAPASVVVLSGLGLFVRRRRS
jgi:hypothetical protein